MPDVMKYIPRERKVGNEIGILTPLPHSIADPLSDSSPTRATHPKLFLIFADQQLHELA